MVSPRDALLQFAPRMSGRQMEVLGMLLEGRRRKEIAAALGTTENTVKKYVARIHERCGAMTTQAIFFQLFAQFVGETHGNDA